MDEADKQPQPPVAKRGEAAWKDNLARIAERNDKAKKAGKQQREEYERGKDERRHARELRERAALPDQPGRSGL